MSTTIEVRGARRRTLLRSTLAVASTIAVGFGASAALATSASAEHLDGEIVLQSGATSGSTPYAGSWVRLHLDGSPGSLYTNTSSPAADQTYTPFGNGTTGLDLDNPQAGVSPHFSLAGNSIDNQIITPALFGPVTFGVTTGTVEPTLTVEDVDPEDPNPPATQEIDGNVGGWTVSYGGEFYPTGGSVTGSVTWDDPSDHSAGGHVKLTWTSDITNGSFSPYTAIWQVEGRLN